MKNRNCSPPCFVFSCPELVNCQPEGICATFHRNTSFVLSIPGPKQSLSLSISLDFSHSLLKALKGTVGLAFSPQY